MGPRTDFMTDNIDDTQCGIENMNDLIDLIEQNEDTDSDSPYQNISNMCTYYEPCEVSREFVSQNT